MISHITNWFKYPRFSLNSRFSCAVALQCIPNRSDSVALSNEKKRETTYDLSVEEALGYNFAGLDIYNVYKVELFANLLHLNPESTYIA